MVSFRNLFTAAVAVSVPVAMAASTPAQVISSLNGLTANITALQTTVNQLTPANALIILPQASNRLSYITNAVARVIDLVRNFGLAPPPADNAAFLDTVNGLAAAINALVDGLTPNGSSGPLRPIDALAITLKAFTEIYGILADELTNIVGNSIAPQTQDLLTDTTGRLQTLLNNITGVLPRRDVLVTRAVTPAQVISGLNSVTALVTALQPTVDQLTQANAVVSFPRIVNDLSTIISTTSSTITTLLSLANALPPVTSALDLTSINAILVQYSQALKSLFTTLTTRVTQLGNSLSTIPLLVRARLVQAIMSLQLGSVFPTSVIKIRTSDNGVQTLNFGTINAILNGLLPGLLQILSGSGGLPILGAPASRVMRGAKEFTANLDVAVEA